MPFCYEDTSQASALPTDTFLSSYCSHPRWIMVFPPGWLAGMMWALSAQFIDLRIRAWLWSEPAWIPSPAPPLRHDSGLVFHPLDLSVLVCNLETIKVPTSEGSREREWSHHMQKAKYGAWRMCSMNLSLILSVTPSWVPEDSCQALFALRVLWSAPWRNAGWDG